MNIDILGMGAGRAHTAKLSALGHDLVMGTMDVTGSMNKIEEDSWGNPPLKEWLKKFPKMKLTTFTEAAKLGDIVMNLTKGEHSSSALRMAGRWTILERSSSTCPIRWTSPRECRRR